LFILVLFTAACAGSTNEAAPEADPAPSPPSPTTITTLTAPTTISTPTTGSTSTVALPGDRSTTTMATTTTGASTTTSTTSADPPTTTKAITTTTATAPAVPSTAEPAGSPQTVGLRFDSRVGDVDTEVLAREALSVLNDPRGWIRAGFTFVSDDAGAFSVILAEGTEVDALCLPLRTGGSVSCQNGPVVALNADRWRTGVTHWDGALSDYRGYLVNHEVGHLIGQRHPTPRCPTSGRPAAVMEQQTGSLAGCVGNAWPRDWEINYAAQRPVVYAPLPAWAPDPVPANAER